EVLDEHVGVTGQRQAQVPAGRLLEIDHHAPLASVDAHEVVALAMAQRRQVARLVAVAGPFDLDDVGGQVGQEPGRERAGQNAGEVQDPDAVKRAIHLCHSPAARYSHGVTLVRGGCAHDCPDTCAWEVTVDGGRAVKLAGAADHPYTRGTLCAKVNHYLDRVYSPHRVLPPPR